MVVQVQVQTTEEWAALKYNGLIDEKCWESVLQCLKNECFLVRSRCYCALSSFISIDLAACLTTWAPLSGNYVWNVFFFQTKFVHEAAGSPVSREQFMMVLSRINVFHIRASYYSAVSKIMYVNPWLLAFSASFFCSCTALMLWEVMLLLTWRSRWLWVIIE